MASEDDKRTSSRKRKAEDDSVEEEEDEVEDTDPEDAAAVISPDGMKLRSGRKKKRKKSTDGLPPAQKKPRKGEHLKQDDDKNNNQSSDSSSEGASDDDESMEDYENDESLHQKQKDRNEKQHKNGKAKADETTSSLDQKPAAVANGAHHATHTTHPKRTSNKRLPTIDKLKLPSQHTPGRKINETAKLPGVAAAATIPPALRLDVRPQQQQPAGRRGTNVVQREVTRPGAVTSPQEKNEEVIEEQDLYLQRRHERLLQGDEDDEATLHRFRRSVWDGLTMLHESLQQMITPLRNDDAGRDFDNDDMTEHLEKTWVWLLILFALVMATQMLVHPVLSSVVSLARVAIPFYKGLVGVHQPVVYLDASGNDAALLGRAQELMQRSDTYKDELVAARDSLFRDLAALDQTAVQSFEESASAAPINPDNHHELLLKKVTDIETLMAKYKTMTPGTLAAMRDVLGEEASVHLLDVFAFDDWRRITGDGAILADGSCGLQRTEAIGTMRALKLEISRETDAIKADSNIVDAVVAWTLANVGDIETPKEEDIDQPKATGSSLDSIQKVIDARLQVELADRTGAVDYAALYNGAAIIRVGKYATSPSLVDRLPYLNRLFATLGLRFYGHGPEVALIPTFPPGALGQCWSFEKDPKPFISSGQFATLSVRLAKPLYVESVSIEHPSREITSQRNSSIRRFRVLGFESPDASGDAWGIGSFEYQIGGEIIQEFETEDEVDDDEVPPLHSITLAIDGTWGADYACLYRLRVHGEEVND